MTGDDGLLQINELTLYYRNSYLNFSQYVVLIFWTSFYAQKSDFQAAGEGCIGALAAPPKVMQGCKNQSNVNTKMASADNNLK